jgi:hypothetical protein
MMQYVFYAALLYVLAGVATGVLVANLGRNDAELPFRCAIGVMAAWQWPLAIHQMITERNWLAVVRRAVDRRPRDMKIIFIAAIVRLRNACRSLVSRGDV